MMEILKGLYRFFSSYALASTVLILLTFVTLFGTLAQKDIGLHQAKKKYFHSTGITTYTDTITIESEELHGKTDAEKRDMLEKDSKLHWIRIPVWFPVPGGLLLMGILFVNMVMGALVHVRKRVRGIPMLIAHFGILAILVSGFVTWTQKRDGYVALYPGTSTNRAQSYREWQIELVKLGENDQPKEVVVIPWESLKDIGDNETQVFNSPEFPFAVRIENFYRNARPIPSSAPISADAKGPEIGGFKLLERNKDMKEEANFPGCFAKIIDPKSNEVATQVILSGTSDRIAPDDQSYLAGFEYGGEKWGIQLVKKSWEIAFSIELDKFIFEKHPGTTKPKNFESRITWHEDITALDDGKKVAIRMNEPMREHGFVVFQESFGPPNPGPNEVMYSQFAVSDDPADSWPKMGLLIMGIGLTLHFVVKLIDYITRSNKQRKAAAEVEATA